MWSIVPRGIMNVYSNNIPSENKLLIKLPWEIIIGIQYTFRKAI